VAMLSSVLNSEQAIQVNINIMRAFVQVRRLGMTIVDVKRKIDGMEKKYDHQFKIVFDAIRQLLAPPLLRRKIKKWDSDRQIKYNMGAIPHRG
jgi:hypothetical protein